MSTLYGWLFDTYPSQQGMTVWLLDNDGRSHALRDSFTPRFYVRGPQEELRAVCEMLRARRAAVDLRRTQRKDLFLDREIDVLEVAVRAPNTFQRLFRQVAAFRPKLTYYDTDIPLPQRYVLARDIFPLAYCVVEHVEGRIHSIKALDSAWEIDYRLPPLRVVTMRLDGELRNPARGHRGNLLVEVEGKEYVFKRERSRELVLGVRHILEHYDPDLLLTAYGDNYLLPRLLELARHYGIPLSLNRDRSRQVRHKPGRSYFSYGRMMYIGEQHLLFGRWHLDRQNAFLADDYGLDGTLEIARITGLPVQTVNRVSTGTGISADGLITGVAQQLIDRWTVAPSSGEGLILAAGNEFSDVTLANLQDMQGNLPEYAEMRPEWFCHKRVWSVMLMRIALASGGVPAAEILMGGEKRILGDPVVIT
ncbi:MAG: hypothetical protein IIC78_07150, partial [Chloroflexi bacterium]|nr:hypothetical protein [Chloroflexota bacterium]